MMERKREAADTAATVERAGAPQDDDAFDLVFKALGHRTRRAILDLLRDRPRTTGDLCAHFPGLDRCTTMQHLRVLEGAGLVVVRRDGRERWNHLDVVPLRRVHDRWIGEYAAGAAGLLTRLSDDADAGRG